MSAVSLQQAVPNGLFPAAMPSLALSPQQQLQTSPRVRPVASFDNSSQSSTTSQQSNVALGPVPDGEATKPSAPTGPHELTPPSSATSSVEDGRIETPDSPTPRKDISKPIHDVAESSRSTSPAGRPRAESAAGSKRTASGQIKHTYHDDGRTPRPEHSGSNHTRGSSAASVGSAGNVAEISQQLRTKLQYAMVKVQHGWQSRSLDEIESLASASPRSITSPFAKANRHIAESPRRSMQQHTSRKWSDSSSSESSHSDFHSTLSTVPEAPEQRRGLAPPADIISGQRRRISPNDRTGTHKSQDLRRSVRPGASQRTPSQNAVLEKDAVETLLFMASPNNSGYHLPSQTSQESSLRSTQVLSAMTSPLRTQFSQTSVMSPKKVAFSDHFDTDGREDRSALIDKMLDELPDESDDDLGDAIHLAGERSHKVAL